MPFVPLGSRKRIEVILDEDKHRISNEMKIKDGLTVKLHHQHMPGATGYKYANHPITMGPVRGPEAPFARANKPWTAPDDDPSGMAALRELEQAPQGASRDGAHAPLGETMRKSRSTPALVRTLQANPVLEGGMTLGEQAKQKANPLSIELSRWARLAEVTNRDLMSMPSLSSKQELYREIPKPKKVVPSANGLVNFPKYMLFENSHAKQQDLLRFIEAENQGRAEAEARQQAAEARQQAVEEAMTRGEERELTPSSTGREAPMEDEVLVPYCTASWGQPRLRGDQQTIKKQWAGSAMAAGKSMRTSNPFRN
jgi:hypothetical protein